MITLTKITNKAKIFLYVVLSGERVFFRNRETLAIIDELIEFGLLSYKSYLAHTYSGRIYVYFNTATMMKFSTYYRGENIDWETFNFNSELEDERSIHYMKPFREKFNEKN